MFTYQDLIGAPSILEGCKGKDRVPLACSRCGRKFFRIKDHIKLERLQEWAGIYCSTSCFRKHPYEKSLSVVNWVTGRICKVCAEWKPLTKYTRGKVPTCNTCCGKKLSRRFYDYQRTSTKRGIPFNLTFEAFTSFQGHPCFYCGAPYDTIRLDRIDGSVGYQVDNLVSACAKCNLGRNTLSQADFLEKCRRIAERHG